MPLLTQSDQQRLPRKRQHKRPLTLLQIRLKQQKKQLKLPRKPRRPRRKLPDQLQLQVQTQAAAPLRLR
jgi:hypothetical protein